MKLSNEALTVDIGGNEYAIKQVTLRQAFVYFENKLKQRRINDARDIAKVLGGKESAEFVRGVWAELAKPTDDDAVVGEMSSLSGIVDLLTMAITNANKSVDKVKLALDMDNLDLGAVAPIVGWILGQEPVKEEHDDLAKKKPGNDSNG